MKLSNRAVPLALLFAFAQMGISSCSKETKEQHTQTQSNVGPSKIEGQRYLAENKMKSGVTTTSSGLQYEVLRAATGDKPKATDYVTVHYRGTLINGKEFDSSYSRNESASFPLKGVIGGWTEGVQLMSVGSKYRFVIPYDLAYGENGAGDLIPPYSVLIFEVELVKIGK